MTRSKIFFVAAGLFLLGITAASAQSSPGWPQGYKPTPAQWNAAFAGKQDYLGGVPCLVTGCTFTGPVVTPASTALGAGFNVQTGVGPTSPNNGDIWITAFGMFVRVNGATIGPLVDASSVSFAATSPLSVSFPSGVATYALTGQVPVANGGTNCAVASGTCLDNITGFSSTGFLTRTGAGTYAFQSATNGVTNANLAQMAAATIKMNATSGAANATDTKISALTDITSPSTTLDWFAVEDHVTNTIRKTNINEMLAVAGAGVTSIDGASGVLTPQAGSLKAVGTQLNTNVLKSRAFAITQDLSAFPGICTLGYASAGDGGQACFQNVGSTTLIDQAVFTGTIAGGSGYAGGGSAVYINVPMTIFPCVAPYATVTVTSGVVTAVKWQNPGQQCAVGAVLFTSNAFLGGSGSGFTYTVTAVKGPYASFIDSVGTHFQYVPSGIPNALQFGCEGDWFFADAGATNNWDCLQYGQYYAGRASIAGFDGAGVTGGEFLVPRGAYMICPPSPGTAQLITPGGVDFHGVSFVGGTILKLCDSGPASVLDVISAGDPLSLSANFGSQIHNFEFYATATAPADSHHFAFYTNNSQEHRTFYDLYIFPGKRGCIFAGPGYGGAASFEVDRIDCEMTQTVGSAGIEINFGTTAVRFTNIVENAGGAGTGENCILLLGGQIYMNSVNLEGCLIYAINVNMTVSTHYCQLDNITGGGAGNSLIFLAPTNTPGNCLIGPAVPNGSTDTVNDDQAGGTGGTGGITIVKPRTWP